VHTNAQSRQVVRAVRLASALVTAATATLLVSCTSLRQAAVAPPPAAQIHLSSSGVFRNGERTAHVRERSFTDTGLTERTTYRYKVAAQDGDFCHLGPKSKTCKVRTPPDLTRPVVENIWRTRDGKHVRVLFSKPMARRRASRAANYQFTPALKVTAAGRMTFRPSGT